MNETMVAFSFLLINVLLLAQVEPGRAGSAWCIFAIPRLAISDSAQMPYVSTWLLSAGIICFGAWSVPLIAVLLKPPGDDARLSKTGPPAVRS